MMLLPLAGALPASQGHPLLAKEGKGTVLYMSLLPGSGAGRLVVRGLYKCLSPHLSADVSLQLRCVADVALMRPQWTRTQRVMTQVWRQHGALLCIALHADPECLVPDSVPLISPAKIKH